MKYSVKVGDRTYRVEIDDLKARPVIATVDGVCFEVQPEEEIVMPAEKKEPCLQSAPIPPTGTVPSGGLLDTKSVRAPIPGVIIDVFIKPSQNIEFGQPLFVIEAMKMRNSIRASRTGSVDEVLVAAGQTVNHNQELMTYTE